MKINEWGLAFADYYCSIKKSVSQDQWREVKLSRLERLKKERRVKIIVISWYDFSKIFENQQSSFNFNCILPLDSIVIPDKVGKFKDKIYFKAYDESFNKLGITELKQMEDNNEYHRVCEISQINGR